MNTARLRTRSGARIPRFHQMLPKEAEALEKKACSAVINVTASLKQLRQG